MGNIIKNRRNISVNYIHSISDKDDETENTEFKKENESFLISIPSSFFHYPIQIRSSSYALNKDDILNQKPIEFYHSFHPFKNKSQLTNNFTYVPLYHVHRNNSKSALKFTPIDSINNSDISFSSYDNDIISFFELELNSNTYLKKKSRISVEDSLNLKEINFNYKSFKTTSQNKILSTQLTMTETKIPSSNSILPQTAISKIKNFQRKNAMKRTSFLQFSDKTQMFPQKTIQYNYHDESSCYRTLTFKNKSLNDKTLLFSLLLSIPFLKSITKEQAYELIEEMHYIQIEPKTLIIKQNSIGTNVFLIKKGNVKLCPLNFPNKIFTIKQGPFVLGERILINDNLRQWDAWSITPVYAYVIKSKFSFNLIKKNIIICDKFHNRLILDKCSTLNLLTDDQKDKLSLYIKKESYEEKETILHLYDRPNSIFILISGSIVDITYNNNKTVIQPGNIFGYNNLIYPKNSQLHIQCNKQCLCFSFVYDSLKEVLEEEENYLYYFRNIFIKQHLSNDPYFKDICPLIENFILNNFSIKFYGCDEIIIQKGTNISEIIYIVMEGDVYLENEHRIKLKEKNRTAVLFSDKVFSNQTYILSHDIKAYTDCFIAKLRKKTVVFHIGKSFEQAKKLLVIKKNILLTKSFNNESFLGLTVLDSLCNLMEEQIILKEGSIIYNEKDLAEKIYFVIEGEVNLINNNNQEDYNDYIKKNKFSMFGIVAICGLLKKNKINKNIIKIKYNETAITSKPNTKLYSITRNNFLSCFNEKELLLYYLVNRIYFMENSFDVIQMHYFPLCTKSNSIFLSKRNPFDQQLLMFKAYKKQNYRKDFLMNEFQKTNKIICQIDNIFLSTVISITFTNDHVFYLSPFISGNPIRTYLFNSTNNFFYLNYDVVKFYSIQLFIAIRTLHRLNLVHRLINHRTILIDDNGFIKLTHVHTVSLLPISKSNSLRIKQGDLCFFAPEMLFDNNEYGYAVDYWAIGMLMYLMICGKLPFGLNFEEEDKANIVGAILNEELVFPGNVINEDFKDFIMKILEKVENKRIKSWDDIVGHPFYKGFKYKDIEMMDMKIPYDIKQVKNEVNVYKNEKFMTFEKMNEILYNEISECKI